MIVFVNKQSASDLTQDDFVALCIEAAELVERGGTPERWAFFVLWCAFHGQSPAAMLGAWA